MPCSDTQSGEFERYSRLEEYGKMLEENGIEANVDNIIEKLCEFCKKLSITDIRYYNLDKWYFQHLIYDFGYYHNLENFEKARVEFLNEIFRLYR